MSRILLLLDHKENEQLLAQELERRHEVVIGQDDAALDEELDLCVLDGRSLDRLWERVQERKAREQPILLPVLLVSSRPDVKMITRQVWRSVDELIITPIEKPELWARAQILLRARDLTLALARRAEEAERATRSRDDVLAIVSHDLRNPLNLVLTSGSFLAETAEGLKPSERQQLEMIQRATRQMDRLIQDLLDIAALETGNVSVEPGREAVEPMLRVACQLQKHAAEAKEVALTCDCEPDLPDVVADLDRVQQVFGNLIGNALKFTEPGGRIEVSGALAHDGASVKFTILDTGPGIGEIDLPHVFDRFWQARRAKDGGAGLGLAIARAIVVAHGGEMRVESVLGTGSTFAFTLPVAPPKGAPPERTDGEDASLPSEAAGEGSE